MKNNMVCQGGSDRMKKKIRVKFTDFYTGFNPETHIIYILLNEMFDVEFSDTPEYLIFGPFGDENLKYLDAIRIFYTGENICPDFNLCDYAIGFDYLEFGDRYLRYPTYLAAIYREDIKKMMIRAKNGTDLSKKKGFCSFVYSNGAATKERVALLEVCNSYKTVASGGGYLNNVGGPVKDKLAFQEKYKFCIACENASHPGYTTEKIMQAFASNAIPIYWGDPKISEVFNSKAFINCHEYDSFEMALQKIIELDCDDAKYLEMMRENPLVSDEYSVEVMDLKLKNFLKRIVEQEYSEAKRYSRDYWCGNYGKYRAELSHIYKKKKNSLLNKSVRFVKRILGK